MCFAYLRQFMDSSRLCIIGTKNFMKFISLGYKQSAVDQAVFYKHLPQVKQLIVIAVHVNDCTIAASTMCLIEELKARLSHHIEVTDLGKLHWMLGIQVRHDCNAHTTSIS
jgi:hypothetical protein